MTNATHRFIEDAGKGGWDASLLNGATVRLVREDVMYFSPNKKEEKWCTLHSVLLDPNAWKAVGKTRRWENEYNNPDNAEMAAEIKATDFLGFLFDGKSIEDALTAIEI